MRRTGPSPVPSSPDAHLPGILAEGELGPSPGCPPQGCPGHSGTHRTSHFSENLSWVTSGDRSMQGTRHAASYLRAFRGPRRRQTGCPNLTFQPTLLPNAESLASPTSGSWSPLNKYLGNKSLSVCYATVLKRKPVRALDVLWVKLGPKIRSGKSLRFELSVHIKVI